MADDRQPPQSYDTTTPAGVGASSSNQVSPGTIQEILDTGDSSLIDQAFDQMTVEDMIAYVDQLPSPPALRTSSPAGVGSSGSQSFRSPQTTPDSSGARTPATPPSVPLAAAGARTAAGAGGNGGGRGGGRGGRGGGRGGGGAGRGGGGWWWWWWWWWWCWWWWWWWRCWWRRWRRRRRWWWWWWWWWWWRGSSWTTPETHTRTTTKYPHVAFDTCLQSSYPSRILDIWEFWPTASYLASSRFTTTFTDAITRSRTIGPRTGNC